MHILDVLDRTAVIPDLKGKNKLEVLEELSAAIAPGLKVLPEKAARVLIEREKLGSTGIGDAIAIPHGKMKGIDRLTVGFGCSRGGIDFEAMDGKPTKLFFVLIAPESSVGDHLKMLARISRLLKDAEVRGRLQEAETQEKILSIIDEADGKQ
jgi:PTS system nitrogen regulatory IIA component